MKMETLPNKFCIYPWVSIEVEPNGDVRPCCMMPIGESFGSLKDSTIDEIWNNDKMQSFRQDMLDGKGSDLCNKCYIVEDSGGSSVRQGANIKFAEHIGKALYNVSPGIKYMDIRFSNVCNFKCRICRHDLSSHWHNDAMKLGIIPIGTPPIIRPTNTREELWEQLEKIIPGLEVIYFAGGEPLITEEHYQVLKFLEEHKMFDVELRYNTNFSRMQYKDLDVMKVWSKFKNVQVGASLDATGKRGEYIRSGQDWNQVIANRKRMMEVCPDAHFYIAATASVFNCLHLPHFHREWVELGYINPDGFHIHALQKPDTQSIQILPYDMKVQLRDIYRDHIDNFISTLEHNGSTQTCFESIEQFAFESDTSQLINSFISETEVLDGMRKESFTITFPELKGING